MEAPGLGQHAENARHDKVPGRGHLHDHHHARDMSVKRNHGDELNRVPHIGQPWKPPWNKNGRLKTDGRMPFGDILQIVPVPN